MFGFSLRTQIDIDAPPARVWAVLMDFPAHARWNPFVRSIEGEARVGARLAIHLQPPGDGGGMRFRPVVRVLEAQREFRWLGRLVLPGLFDGEHAFRLEPLPGGGTRLHHGEDFSGLLVPLFGKSLEGGTRAGFEAMNAALKREAEGG